MNQITPQSVVVVLAGPRTRGASERSREVCSEMWPSNTAEVPTLLPVIDRLKRRFSIGRICIVADRGMISAETIAGPEARRLIFRARFATARKR